MSESFVTVATFDNSIDAHIAKTKLDSEGIDSYIFDENIVSAYPLYNITVGGIKLRTRSSDAENARIILNHVNDSPFTDEKDNVIRCPNCNSEKVYGGFVSINSLKTIVGTILAFITGASPIVYETKLKCKDCGFEFKKKS
jgi:predicted Zn-ribbon and HTH transcriptional regulator